MTQIRKAVIPSAGFGTRVLPLTKSMPKQMIPIVDKPCIHYIVMEAINSGITDILIVVGQENSIIKDYFSHFEKLENLLAKEGKSNILHDTNKMLDSVNISFVTQNSPLGLGDAILKAEDFINNEPFAVLYGDDLFNSKTPVCKQLIKAYEKYNKGVVAINKVIENEIMKYNSVSISHIENGIFNVDDMIEKPSKNEIVSDYSIMGRCILPPEIFNVLKSIPYGKNGELQLTDAMKILSNNVGMIGLEYEGKRFDIGDKLGILKANVEFGVSNQQLGKEFKKYLKTFINSI